MSSKGTPHWSFSTIYLYYLLMVFLGLCGKGLTEMKKKLSLKQFFVNKIKDIHRKL